MAKIADDLYCGGNTPEQFIHNWERVLDALQKSSLNLSASKTIIAPSQATILGWTWQLGTIRANKHRISTLSGRDPPQTVTALRSFIGAYKVISRVVQGTSQHLAPLDDVVASSYRVKVSDCFKVPVISNPAMLADKSDKSSDEEPEKFSTSTSLPALPGIPKEISSIPKPNISVEPSSAEDIDNPPEPPDIQSNPLPEKKFSDFVMY